MFRALSHITPKTWILSLLTLAVVLFPFVASVSGVFDAHAVTYVMQPVLAAVLAGSVFANTRFNHSRVRHRSEKAFIVGSVCAIWFVAYFATGVMTTYVHNAVTSSMQAIMQNIVAFGVTAVSFEIIRHKLLLLAGRRHIIWYGTLLSLIIALAHINILALEHVSSAVDIIKFFVSDIVPAVIASFVLSYLSVNAGLAAQLVYRLSIFGVMYLAPIIPKHDWYMSGISWLFLAIAVYIVVDRSNGDEDISHKRPKRTKRAADIMFVILMIGLVLFMTGAFSYRPQAIMSNSMHPIFSRGSIVVVEKSAAMDVQVGDIVQYEAPNHYITHRVIRTELSSDGSGERLIITKGDNSPSEDTPVKPKQIVGIIRAQIPYIGYPTVWLKELTAKGKA
jgi:signal peptidase